MMKRRTILGGVCAAAGCWATGSRAAAAASASDGELVIGQVAPLTGVIAGTGNEYVAGAAAYFAHVNAQGGINGRRIRVALRDDAYNPEKTLQQTRELLAKEKPVALFGFVGTGNVLSLHKNKVLGDEGIALLAPYTGAMDLRDPAIGNIFHIRASYTDETARMVEHLNTIGIRRIAVMYQDDPFGKSGLAGAQAAMAQLNITPVALGHYDRTKPEEVDEAAATIAAAKPEAVIMVAVNRASAAFARKLHAAGSAARLFSISVVNFKELLKNAGEALARGIGISQVMPFPYAASTPVVREFQALMAQYAPDKTVSYASIESFVGAKVLVEALRRAGNQPTREKVMRSLQDLRSYDAGGFKVGFTPTNRIGSRFVEVTVIGQGGRLLR
jgi:branched-chain amino acid transport system substrate-binding protein